MARVLPEASLVRLRHEELAVSRSEEAGNQERREGDQHEHEEDRIFEGEASSGDGGGGGDGTSGGNSGVSDSEKIYQQRIKRTRNRKRKSGMEDEDDYVNARIPKDLLYRLSLLAAILDVSLRAHLTYTVAFYESCGVDSTKMDLSLASAFRYRRQQAGQVADQALQNAAQEVIEKNSKIFVHFDTKLMEQDFDGVLQTVERLAVIVSSPVLENDQLLCAFPLESGTGEAMAEAIYGMLMTAGLEQHVMGLVADTTATNFGPYNGAIVILQVHIGQNHLQ